MADIALHHTGSQALHPAPTRLLALAAALFVGFALAQIIDLSVLDTGVTVTSDDWHGNVMRSHYQPQ
ncbi:hypothetical protein [Poseidonocella sedimentorum]|uniref:Uncharacterized protein n=1 Tax=Poseidonocella sedimentorum TaxID=871652 RepID=A0A1I6CPZ9_9RHOB|nr:hypothetical protein [Poseidonocella sedimentorum]SFQ95233.1 hypothetical protein SAMN04515673_101174 [Poseidonocella sedimentorum]